MKSACDVDGLTSCSKWPSGLEMLSSEVSAAVQYRTRLASRSRLRTVFPRHGVNLITSRLDGFASSANDGLGTPSPSLIPEIYLGGPDAPANDGRGWG